MKKTFSVFSIVLFMVVEWVWLGRLTEQVNRVLDEGTWTNTVLYRLALDEQSFMRVVFLVLFTWLVLGAVLHYGFQAERSLRETATQVGRGWVVPLLLACIGLLIPNLYLQLLFLFLQLTFIPLIPFIEQTVRWTNVVVSWLAHLFVLVAVGFVAQGWIRDMLQIEKTDLLLQLEAYQASGDLARIQRILEQVDVAQVERLLEQVDLNQLLRILERVDLNRLEQILNVFL